MRPPWQRSQPYLTMKRCRVSVNVTKQERMKTNQVAASSESMVNPLPVRAFVPRRKIRKLLVRSRSHLLREQIVKLAGIEEQRRFALLDVCLPAVWSAGTHKHLRGRTLRSSGLMKDGCVMTDTRIMFSKARSKTRRARGKKLESYKTWAT
jgi:hypothetical protein